MADGTLVRGARLGLEFYIGVVGAGLMIAGAVDAREGVGVFVVVAALFAGFVVWGLVAACRPRTVLHVRPAGFTVEARGGRFEYADADVSAVGFDETVHLSNGEARGTRRKAVLSVGAGDEQRTVAMDYVARSNRPDPVGPLLKRLSNQVLVRAREQLARGQRFAGPGWALDREGLWTSGADGDRLIPDTQLAAASVIDGHLAAWERGQELPTVRLPAGGPNVRVLGTLLRERVAGQPGSGAAGEDLRDGLGRILFERDVSLATPAFAVLFLSVLSVFGLAAVAFAAPDVLPGKHPQIWATVMATFALVVAIPTLAYRRNRFVCHVAGVTRVNFWGTSQLRYSDLASFTYAAVRQYVNGLYTGTTFALRFKPRRGVAGRRITFQTSVRNADAALDGLRQAVSEVMARELLARLAAGEVVPWTAGYQFAPDDLVCPPRGVVFGRRSTLVPYRDIQQPEIEKGTLRLWVASDRMSFASLTTGTENFFPGLVVLGQMLSRRVAGSATAANQRGPVLRRG